MSAEPVWVPFLLQEIPETLPESPVPGGIAAVVRFLFEVPRWLQIGGAVVGFAIGVWVLALLWARRRELWGWVRSRRRGWQIGLGIGAATVVIVAAGFGGAGWNYVQHENEFCTGCHVMDPAYGRFQDSEHADLSCHDCHRQSIFASTRQLYLWVVDRPAEIGEHAPVPNRVCGECHLRRDADSTWQRIVATAGHAVHLQSDSSVLADLQCVRCHGQEVHRFIPADQTCGQADCHAPTTIRIALGAMASQTGFHCVTCHEFAAPVAEGPVAEGREAEGVLGPLVPGRSQCFSCHEMEALWAEYGPAADPHEARCGACHNPHAQELPASALRSCTDAGCHGRPDTLTAFHRGLPGAVTENCTGCHAPHVWVRRGEACGACHADVPGSEARTALLRTGYAPGAPVALGPVAGTSWHGPSPGSLDPPPGDARRVAVDQQASLRHRDHVDVPCTDCHATEGETHGQVIIGSGDCATCHHGSRGARVGCGGCHGAGELAGRRTVGARFRLSVWDTARARRLPFDHRDHADGTCGTCHGGPSVEEVAAACTDCHEEHHRATASCRACHEEHRRDAHTARVHTDGCTGSGCHADPGYFDLDRTRSFCLVCHQDQVDHEAGNRCTECHLVRSPGASVSHASDG